MAWIWECYSIPTQQSVPLIDDAGYFFEMEAFPDTWILNAFIRSTITRTSGVTVSLNILMYCLKAKSNYFTLPPRLIILNFDFC